MYFDCKLLVFLIFNIFIFIWELDFLFLEKGLNELIDLNCIGVIKVRIFFFRYKYGNCLMYDILDFFYFDFCYGYWI